MNEGTHKNNITKTASATMSRGAFVKLTAADAGKVEACSDTDTDALGVLLDSVEAGDNVAVELLGVSNRTFVALADGQISAGGKVCLSANGAVKAIPAKGASAQTVQVVGLALGNSVGKGDLVEIVAHRCQQLTIAAQ